MTAASRPRVLLALVAGLALLVSACDPASSTAFTASNLGAGEDGWRGIPLELDPPRTLPDVTLGDIDGEEVALAEDLLGDPVLLFFGYTSCPDICPIHLRTIASSMESLGVSTRQIQVVFVSVDPARDTAERMREYTEVFDRNILGLRAEIDVIEDALAQLDLPGPVVEGVNPRDEGELIGHPAQVIGFDADGVAQRVWPFGTRRVDWIEDMPRILEEWTRDDDADQP
ncbi:SCO family protein [Nitriliruptor alkaliphilus]|uniref:SCO family protein n=1 Tax=Nitriliruptor alkaliphilus TaxID=427918 RepID=UPI00069795B7|nr:SCO family protein [Nitriliruptor alkaliphilus]